MLFFNLKLRNGRNPLDLIAPGSRLECQAFQDSLSTWIVTVVDNIGGRLKLRYEGLESSDNFELWLYYLDPFLHHVGWAAQQGYELQPPLGEEQCNIFLLTYIIIMVLLISVRLKNMLFCMLQKPFLVCIREILQKFSWVVKCLFFFLSYCFSNLPYILKYLLPHLKIKEFSLPKLKNSLGSIQTGVGVGQVFDSKQIVDEKLLQWYENRS